MKKILTIFFNDDTPPKEIDLLKTERTVGSELAVDSYQRFKICEAYMKTGVWLLNSDTKWNWKPPHTIKSIEFTKSETNEKN